MVISDKSNLFLSNKSVVSGHPYPSMFPTKVNNPRFLQNVLLSSAKAYFKALPPQSTNIGESPKASLSKGRDSEEDHQTDSDEINPRRSEALGIQNESNK